VSYLKLSFGHLCDCDKIHQIVELSKKVLTDRHRQKEEERGTDNGEKAVVSASLKSKPPHQGRDRLI